jgi:hypothetical protein
MLSLLAAAQAARTGIGWVAWIKTKAATAIELWKRRRIAMSMRTHETWYWISHPRKSADVFEIVAPT